MNAIRETSSWVTLAQEIIEKAAYHETIEVPSQLASVMLATRRQLQPNCNPDELTALFSSWDNALRQIQTEALISPDQSQETEAQTITSLIENTKLQLRFLHDLYEFQQKHWETSQSTRGRNIFTPATIEDFLTKHPEYERGLITATASSYRELIAKIGLPISPDHSDQETLRRDITAELWRIYNQKNGLPSNNKTYKKGTSLPKINESHYSARAYQAAFGNFRKAVRAVIQDSIIANPYAEAGCLTPSKTIIHRALQKSLELGRLPTREEIEAPVSNWEMVKNGIRKELETDLYEAIRCASISVPQIHNPKKQSTIFNWRLLLLRSEYFAQYGVQIYDLWLNRDRLEQIIDDKSRQIREILRRVFLVGTPLAHMRKAAPLFKMPPLPENFENISRAELTTYIEQDILKKKIPPHANMSTPHAKAVLQRWVDEGITIAPTQSHLILINTSAKTSLQRLYDKAAFFRRNPDIPLYMRQIIYGLNGTKIETIERTVEIFEEEKVPRALYVHFLHCTWEEQIRRTAHTLKNVAKSNDRIQAHLDQLAIKQSSAPPTTPPPPSTNLGHQASPTDIPKTESQESKDAKARLAELGHPFESLPKNIREKYHPVTIVAKAEFMLENFGQINPALLGRSDAIIRKKMGLQAAQTENQAEAQAELEDLIRERGLVEPPAYLTKNYKPARILEIIHEIEARGVPFDGTWSWINASKHQREQGVEKAWKTLTRDKRIAEAGEIFGFSPEAVPPKLSHHDPDTIVAYGRIYRRLGQKITSSAFHTIHQFSLPSNFRKIMAERLTRCFRRPPLTPEEEFWLNGQTLAKAVGDQLKTTKYRTITHCELLEEASLSQQQRITTILEAAETTPPSVTNRQLKEVLKTLYETIDLKQQVRAALRYHRLGYADMEACCASRTKMKATLKKIAYLEAAKITPTPEMLYRDLEGIEDLEELLDSSNLSPAQQMKRAFLTNLGCSPLWVEKLSRSDIPLAELRQTAFFLSDIELEEETHGKSFPETQDYEEYLDKPLAYCQKYVARRIGQALANVYAKQKLRDAFGVRWDHVQGWVAHRTTEATMWEKFELLTQEGELKDEVLANPDLVTRYSLFSLEQIKAYIREISEALETRRISSKQKKDTIQILLRVLHIIARISHRTIISEKILERAYTILLSKNGLTELIAKAEEIGRRTLSSPEIAEFLTDDYALKLYEKTIALLTEPEKPKAPTPRPSVPTQPKSPTRPTEDFPHKIIDLGPRGPLLTRDEEKELGIRKDSGDTQARDILITRNLRLVVWVAKQYTWTGLPLSDLIQEGNIGLIKGVEKWEHHRGIKLSTYASFWIRAIIQRYIEEHRQNVRIPGHLQALITKINRTRLEFYRNNQRQPTPEELAKITDISVEKIETIEYINNNILRNEVQLDAPINDEPRSNRFDEILGQTDGNYGQLEEDQHRAVLLRQLRAIINEAFPKKAKQAWDILINRFGFNEDQTVLTLNEIGIKYGVTRARIQQIEAQILQELRNHPELREELLLMIRD